MEREGFGRGTAEEAGSKQWTASRTTLSSPRKQRSAERSFVTTKKTSVAIRKKDRVSGC